MTQDEIQAFVDYVDQAWNPRLNPTQSKVWTEIVTPLDARPAFDAILKMIKTEKYRPAPIDFMQAYRQRLRDTTPVQPLAPSGRDELPEWVGGWELARDKGDKRLWPEQKKGFRILHEEWIADCTYNREERRKMNLKSGYEWEENVADLGLMPQEDRLAYMARWREGERVKGVISQLREVAAREPADQKA